MFATLVALNERQLVDNTFTYYALCASMYYIVAVSTILIFFMLSIRKNLIHLAVISVLKRYENKLINDYREQVFFFFPQICKEYDNKLSWKQNNIIDC